MTWGSRLSMTCNGVRRTILHGGQIASSGRIDGGCRTRQRGTHYRHTFNDDVDGVGDVAGEKDCLLFHGGAGFAARARPGATGRLPAGNAGTHHSSSVHKRRASGLYFRPLRVYYAYCSRRADGRRRSAVLALPETLRFPAEPTLALPYRHVARICDRLQLYAAGRHRGLAISHYNIDRLWINT